MSKKMTDEEMENDEQLQMGVMLDRFSRGVLDPYDGNGEYTDVLDPLRDAVIVQEWLSREIAQMVYAARAEDVSWENIGATLGTSRQAAWERFGNNPGAGGWNKGKAEERFQCPHCMEWVAKSWKKRHLAKHDAKDV